MCAANVGPLLAVSEQLHTDVYSDRHSLARALECDRGGDGVLAVLGGGGTLALLLTARRKSDSEYELIGVESRDGDVTAYLATYLLPIPRYRAGSLRACLPEPRGVYRHGTRWCSPSHGNARVLPDIAGSHCRSALRATSPRCNLTADVYLCREQCPVRRRG